MKKNKSNKIIFIILLLLIGSNLQSNSLENIVCDSILSSSKKYNIEPKVFMSIVDTESNFSPYPISVVLNKKKAFALSKELKNNHIKHVVRKYKKSKIVSIDPSTIKNAIKALIIVKKTKSLKYDLGIAQINKCKIIDKGWDEIKILTDLPYSIDKSAKIIRNCMNIHKDTKKAIECYNKGEYAKYIEFDYYSKVKKAYDRSPL